MFVNKVHSFTLYSLAQVVSPPLLVDDRLVDLSSGEVVVPGKTDVQETLIVPQVQIHLPAVIENKNFTCTTQTLLSIYHKVCETADTKLAQMQCFAH